MMGDFIKKEIKPDVILWTGDIPPHDNYNYSMESTMTYSKFLADYFTDNFTDYSIHVLEGNHDFEVVNSQDFREPDPILTWNAMLWDKYLDEEAKKIYV